MFGKSGVGIGAVNPKHYNQFTSKFDNNYLKTGLRKWNFSSINYLIIQIIVLI